MKYLYRSTVTNYDANGKPTIFSTGPARKIQTEKGIEYVSEAEYKKLMEQKK